jgi:hypothetical protein
LSENLDAFRRAAGAIAKNQKVEIFLILGERKKARIFAVGVDFMSVAQTGER